MKTLVAFVVLLAAAPGGAAGQKPLARFEFSEPHMGTTFRIVLYATDSGLAAQASRAAFDRIAALDNIMTDYQAGSELMRVSARAGGPPMPVSDDLFHVLSAAQEISERSGGAFDVTVGPVVRLWRMARLSHHFPDPQRLADAERHVGFRKVRLDAKTRTIQLLEPGMLLDLGGIAKGYASDAALNVLEGFGITRALVAGGGDIAVGDPPPGKQGWTIGVAPLASPSAPPQRYLLLHNAAVSTSGDAEQHLEIKGVRYSHVVDPKTGKALTGRRSATVVAKDCTTSDALATAVCVLGPERGIKLIKTIARASALIAVETPAGVRTSEWNFPSQPANSK